MVGTCVGVCVCVCFVIIFLLKHHDKTRETSNMNVVSEKSRKHPKPRKCIFQRGGGWTSPPLEGGGIRRLLLVALPV